MTLTTRFALGYVTTAAVCCLLLDACIVGDKCDANQHYVLGTVELCECDPGYVVSSLGYGCEKCGDNEDVSNGKCVCKEGYTRPGDTGACQSTSSSPGSACTSAADCGEAFPYCAMAEDAPYCTMQGCTVSDDCPENWRCVSVNGESFCRKPPSGLGQSCQANADCMDPDVAYCEAFMSHTCLINECASDPGKCVSQTTCCDLTSLIGESICVPKSFLTPDGKCYGGADPVRP